MALTTADDLFVDESKNIDLSEKQPVRAIAANDRDALMKAIGQQEIAELSADTRNPKQATGESQTAVSKGVSPQGDANSEDEETEEDDDEDEDEDLEGDDEEDDELEDEDVDDEDDEDADDEEEDDEEEDEISAPTAPANGKRGNT